MRFVVTVIIFLLVSIVDCKASKINASNYGFNNDDATSCLQKALDSKYDTVIINLPTIWNIRPVFIRRDNLTLIIARGAILYAMPGYSITSCLITIQPVTKDAFFINNIKIIGYGSILKMRKASYNEALHSEFRHCIAIMNGNNVKIVGLQITDSGGDGIMVGSLAEISDSIAYSKNITIEDCVFDNNKRQGVSIISVRALHINHCVMENTNGTAPSAGIDIEPDFSFQIIQQVLIENCDIKNNDGNGLQIFLSNMESTLTPSNIKINDCVIHSNKKYGLFIYGANRNHDNKQIDITNCVIDDNSNGIQFAANNYGNINITNSFLRTSVTSKSNELFLYDMETNQSLNNNLWFGGFKLNNSTIWLNDKQNLSVRYLENTHKYKGTKDISGVIYIIGNNVAAGVEDFTIYSVPSNDINNPNHHVDIKKIGDKILINKNYYVSYPENLSFELRSENGPIIRLPLLNKDKHQLYQLPIGVLSCLNTNKYQILLYKNDRILNKSDDLKVVFIK